MMKTCAVDEVGCASIAGPVFVCAVVVDDSAMAPGGIADSKKLSKKRRENLFPVILERIDDFAFGAAGPRKIEQLNIHHAKFLAMRQAVEKLLRRGHRIGRTIVDGGFEIPGLPLCIAQEAHPKADDTFWEVSAASILAKVTRDRLMARLAQRPGLGHYDWENNAGYYTPKHRLGIVLHGPTPYHRRTFDFFKYCLFSHKEYRRFLAEGKTAEDYFECEDVRRAALGKRPYSYYKAWKRGDFHPWQPVLPESLED